MSLDFISQGILIRSWKKRHFKAVKGKLYYYEVSKLKFIKNLTKVQTAVI